MFVATASLTAAAAGSIRQSTRVEGSANGQFAWTVRPPSTGCVGPLGRVVVLGEPPYAEVGPTPTSENCSTPGPSLACLIEKDGTAALTRLESAFALVVWCEGERTLTAIRDHLGQKPLYYLERAQQITVSDSLDGFEHGEAVDREYVSGFIAARGDPPNDGTTIRPGIRAVPPGSFLTWHAGRVRVEEYWSPHAITALPTSTTPNEVAAEFYRRLCAAVRSYVGPDGSTWAHLSGGLDSSSVVCTACKLGTEDGRDSRLGGTVTFRDDMANADEMEFVRSVLAKYAVENVVIENDWPWRADGEEPPLTDRPSRDYPFFARDRRVARAAAAGGAKTILSGVGPDVYLPQTATHCADLVWGFRYAEAIREIHAASVALRESVWSTAWRQGIQPLIARRARARREIRKLSVPSWFKSSCLRGCDASRLLERNWLYAGSRGHYYKGEVARLLRVAVSGIGSWMQSDRLTIAHPLLHRPLVELCLSMPYRLRTDPYWPKPVLRAAMKGVLPEQVRRRGTKAILSPRMYWAFRNERSTLERLLREPVLADIGVIEPSALRNELLTLTAERSSNAVYLFAALSLETWLSRRAGRRVIEP